MPIQSEIIYPESIMSHLTSLEFCPVFDKNRARVRLCVCSGVLILVTYSHDRFFVTVTSRMDIIHDVTKWAVHLCLQLSISTVIVSLLVSFSFTLILTVASFGLGGLGGQIEKKKKNMIVREEKK